MSNFIVPELGTAFSNQRIDGVILRYIYDEWTLTDPAKPTTFPSNDTISFRVGFWDFFRPYEVTVLKQETQPTQWLAKNRVELMTILTVNLRMQRIDRDGVNVDPQLADMEEEIMRIAMQYQAAPQDITGIKNIIWGGERRDYSLSDEYSTSDWRSICTLNVQHERVSTL